MLRYPSDTKVMSSTTPTNSYNGRVSGPDVVAPFLSWKSYSPLRPAFCVLTLTTSGGERNNNQKRERG